MRRTAGLAALAAAVLVGACQDTPSSPEPTAAPILRVAQDQGALRDRYIVVFRASVQDPDALTDQLIRAHGGQVHFRYRTALKGFAATLPSQSLEGIRRNPNVSYLEQDGVATIGASGSQNNPPSWGLDRINEQARQLDKYYNWEADGSGVRVYILDTGIRYDHQEFEGRAIVGRDFITSGGDASDCHGHGTHVAGTVGGRNVGVAKQATLVAVRVLGCSGSGSYSGIIAAVDWLTAEPYRPAVSNMSLGGGANSSLNTAVNNSVDAGVVHAVAAGNDNADACTRSPASAAKALTTGATTSSDSRASYSNYGTCLDIFAPGSSIYSSTYNGTDTYASWSGTSMASPHVAGVAAIYLSAYSTATPSQVETAIKDGATKNVVGSAGTGSPNQLLYSLIAGGGSEPPPPPPPPPPPAEEVTVFVQDLSGGSSWANRSRKQWRAAVTILVHNTSGNAVSGVTVTGNWSNGTSGSTTCTTGSAGTCSVTSGNVSSGTSSVRWNVGTLSGTGLAYDSTKNVESFITVSRPN